MDACDCSGVDCTGCAEGVTCCNIIGCSCDGGGAGGGCCDGADGNCCRCVSTPFACLCAPSPDSSTHEDEQLADSGHKYRNSFYLIVAAVLTIVALLATLLGIKYGVV